MVDFYSRVSVDELRVPIRNYILSKNLNSPTNKTSLSLVLLAIFSSVYYLKNFTKIFCKKVIFLSDSGSRTLFGKKYYDQIFDLYIEDRKLDGVLIELPNIGVNYSRVNSFGDNRIWPGLLVYSAQFLFEILLSAFKRHELNSLCLSMFKEGGGVSKVEMKKIVASYWAKKIFFNLIFQLGRCEKVILKSSYSLTCLALISAAKDNEVCVEELQHSHIYEGHYGYFYEDTYLQVFKEFFMPTLFIPYNEFYSNMLRGLGWQCSSRYLGNPYFRSHQKYGVSGFKKEKYDILIISQHNLTKDISRWVDGYLISNPEAVVGVKCHPRGAGEFDYYRQHFKNNSNVRVVGEGSIYDYLLLSKAVAGVYSSGLIDAIGIGLPIYILPIKGNSKMQSYIDSGMMRVLT